MWRAASPVLLAEPSRLAFLRHQAQRSMIFTCNKLPGLVDLGGA